MKQRDDLNQSASTIAPPYARKTLSQPVPPWACFRRRVESRARRLSNIHWNQ